MGFKIGDRVKISENYFYKNGVELVSDALAQKLTLTKLKGEVYPNGNRSIFYEARFDEPFEDMELFYFDDGEFEAI